MDVLKLFNKKLSHVLSVIWLLLASIFLSACDTMSLYHARDSHVPIADTPTERMRSRQQLTLDQGQTLINIYINRFNFNFSANIEIENRGKTPLQFFPWRAILTGGNGKELRVIKILETI
jgi:hypothetical protein